MASSIWGGSGSATAVAAKVDIRNPRMVTSNPSLALAGALAIKNNGAVTISLSWDGGKTYPTTVATTQSLRVASVLLDSIWVKTAAVACAFEWIARDKEED